ncbi:hypothetical protein [Silvibacterium sp.]|uniref:hypothetical protein n=1 Tax=Silvibacterium sp. TaxID=1964179 RepID=UPI0039E52CF4
MRNTLVQAASSSSILLARATAHFLRSTAGLFAIAVLSMTLIALLPYPATAQNIPSNALGGCPVATTTFNSWFKSGSPSANGIVNPANSLNFTGNSNCPFYQWSEQMFLWLLSPAPATYGGGGHVFDSPTFYDVSPLNANDQRTLTRHIPGIFPIVGVRVPTPGPHGLPVILDKQHRLFEIAPAKRAADGKTVLLNSAGQEVEVESATIVRNTVVFKDAAGKTILGAKPALSPELLTPPAARQAKPRISAKTAVPQARRPQIAQRLVINGKPIFIDPFGNIINPVDPEEGQATGDALLSQAGSLVYYTIVVNDVFAYFLTGNKTGGFPAQSTFPTTAAQLSAISTFASQKGVTFPDSIALSVEIKMSWVDASTVPNAGDYVTVKATVPQYQITDKGATWVPNGTKNITLALVGVHFVGTVAGHPEMIWATFEHFGNTPNAAYTYASLSGIKTVPQDSLGTWLFCATGCPGSSTFNSSHAKLDGANIVGHPSGSSVTPSNTLRVNPWGMPSGTAATIVASNTQLVSINHSVLSQLLSGDIRQNYFLIGATWTANGAPPSTGTQVGTNQLANSTMETYIQGSNCFACHTNEGAGPDGMLGGTASVAGLSHIYYPLQPLP